MNNQKKQEIIKWLSYAILDVSSDRPICAKNAIRYALEELNEVYEEW